MERPFEVYRSNSSVLQVWSVSGLMRSDYAPNSCFDLFSHQVVGWGIKNMLREAEAIECPGSQAYATRFNALEKNNPPGQVNDRADYCGKNLF